MFQLLKIQYFIPSPGHQNFTFKQLHPIQSLNRVRLVDCWASVPKRRYRLPKRWSWKHISETHTLKSVHFANRSYPHCVICSNFWIVFRHEADETPWHSSTFQILESTLPVRTPDFSSFSSSALSATWLGHATVCVKLDDVWLITDPVWSPRAFSLSFIGPVRYRPPPVAIEKLPKVIEFFFFGSPVAL